MVLVRPWDEARSTGPEPSQRQASLSSEGGGSPYETSGCLELNEWMNRGHFLHPCTFKGCTASQQTPSLGHQVTHCGSGLWQQQLALFEECFPFLHPKSLKSPPLGNWQREGERERQWGGGEEEEEEEEEEKVEGEGARRENEWRRRQKGFGCRGWKVWRVWAYI